MSKVIYLDNSSTTRPFDEVIEYMNEINRNIYGNPSSLHQMGIDSEKLVIKARESIAASMNVQTREIYFTSGGTESNNFAIRGYLNGNPRKGKKIITTKVEHPSVIEVFKELESHGYKVNYIDVDSKGIIDLDILEESIDSDTSLISIIYVNNETGAIQPLEEIIRIKNRKNKSAVVHIDAVQAYGKLKFYPRRLGVDMVSVSSHKIHGPKGIGALYVNRDIRIKPIIFGGGQESALRSGTENVPAICGFGLAVEMVFRQVEENLGRLEKVKKHFIEKLFNHIKGVKINSPEGSLPYIINIAFPDIRAEVLLHHLGEKNIFVSTGSACSSRRNVHSHVLTAMGLPKDDIEGAIRFSLSSITTEDELDYTVEALAEIVPTITIKNR